MKRRFCLSLFHKIFLITFIGLFVVQTTNLYLDYRKLCTQIAYSYMDDEVDQKLVDLANDAKSLTTEDIIQNVNEAFQDSSFYYMVIENKEKIITENLNYHDFSNEPYIIMVSEDVGDFPYQVLSPTDSIFKHLSLQDVPETKRLELEEYIQTYAKEKAFNVKCVSEEKIESHQTRKIPTYLQIDDQIIVDGDDTSVSNYLMHVYSSKNMYYQDYHNNEDSKPFVLTGDELLSISQTSALKSVKELDVLGQGIAQHDYEKHGDNLILKYISHIYSDSDHRELDIVVVDYRDSAFLDTFSMAYNDNVKVYMLSLVMSLFISLLISYILTKRIKAMNSATHLISRNRFDMVLNENPKDELGELSANINRMSRNLKSTIDQLNDEIEHVKELESLRKDFVNQFTHEMKTPLGIINGYSELLDEAESDEEKEKYLEIINHETDRINQLIQAMLNLSRLEAGKVELHKEEVDLEDIVTDIIEEYEVLLMKKHIHVDIKVIHNMIHADAKHIQTVVRNFLSNAIKHTFENGKIVITIDNGVSVLNEGKPIEEDRLNSIWYTFVTHDKNGSGLGLAICRSILELHGFDYGVNNLDNGVEFYFHQ